MTVDTGLGLIQILVIITIINFKQLNRCKLNEKKIYDLLGNNYAYHRNEIEEISKMEKSTLIRTINALISKGLLVKEGSARATTYKKK